MFNMSCEGFYDYTHNTPMYINLPMELAVYKACPLTVGRGLLINAKDEKIQEFLTKWYNKENMWLKLWKNEQWCSVIGRSVMYLLPTKSGHLTCRVATWNIMNRISTVDEQEQIAVIYDTPYRSDLSTYQKITFTPNKVMIETYTGQMTMVEGVSAEVPDNKKIKEETFETGLNFLPFIEFTNLPVVSWFANTNLVYHPDWLHARQLIDDVQDAIQVKRKERKGNRTRIRLQYNKASLQEAEQLGIEGALRELADTDVVINENSVAYGDKMQGNNLGMMIGDPKLDLYNQDIWNTIELFYRMSGYDMRNDVGGQYKNKTESIMETAMDYQTTAVKQTYRITKLKKLFMFVLIHEGLASPDDDYPFELEFISLAMEDKLKLMEQLEKGVALGITSRAEAKARWDNIPISIAEEKLKAIDEDLDKQLEREMKYADTPPGHDDGDKGLEDEII